MCGIAGIWKFKEELALSQLKTFTDSMEHRGPDGSGYELLNRNSLGLGHRRLSILDLSENGKQPMVFDNYTIVFNGEIFNFQEIKIDLISKGYTFKTETDTEVLLVSYKEWGEEAFHKWNGMWAFALYDSIKEELLLCSDRFGIKPCYYTYEEGERFSFASETYAFRFLENFSKEVDMGNLLIELDDPYIIEPLGYTLFKGINRLLPGHTIRLKKGESPVQRRWYDIRERNKDFTGSFTEATNKFHDLLIDSTKLRLQSDVALATALSGGLDSSAVLGVIQHISENNMALERSPKNLHKSYTMTFPGWDKDESFYAQKVLDFNKRQGVFLEVKKENFENNIKDVSSKSDFIVEGSLLPLVELYGKMKEDGISVSLDGHGVDEMLFGYKSMLWKLYELETQENKDLESLILKSYVDSDRVKIEEYLERLKRNKKFPIHLISKLKYFLKGENKIDYPKSLSDKPYNWKEKAPRDIVFNYFFNGSLIPILRNFDKASMLASVEVRMPFMDYRLVEFCFSLPLEYLINEDFSKLILRESAKNYLPQEVLERKTKLGFLSPIDSWMETLLSESYTVIEKDVLIQKVLSKWNKGELNNSQKWMLYNLSLIATNPSEIKN